MSNETDTPKKSILTDAALRARAIQDAKKDGQDIRTPEEIAAKRALKKAGLILAGTIATVVAVIVISSKLSDEDETSKEETPSED